MIPVAEHQILGTDRGVGSRPFSAVELTGAFPGGPLGGERGRLLRTERGDVLGVLGQEAVVLGQREGPVGDVHRAPPGRHVGAQFQQLLGRYRIPRDPIEKPEQPGASGLEGRGVPVPAPDLGGAADELVAAGALHAVDAQVRTADADGVLRGPGAGRVVLRGHQPVAGIQRGGHRRAQVDVTEAQRQVLRGEDGVIHIGLFGQTIDPPDELDIRRAPRGVVADPGGIPGDRLPSGRVVPAQRKPHPAARHHQFGGGRQLVLDLGEQAEQAGHRQHIGVDVNLQRADPGGEVVNTRMAACQLLMQGVHPGPQRQIQDDVPVFDEHIVIAAAAVGDRRCAVDTGPPGQHPVITVPAARKSVHPATTELVARGCFGRADRDEPDAVTGAQLAQFPPLPRHHGDGADEPAQARAVGTEQNGGVPGEIERADRVGVVVDVRRVQAGLAAVGTSPLRFRTFQSHTGTGGIEMHPVCGLEQGVDIAASEELRRPVRPLGDRELPFGAEHGAFVRWHRATGCDPDVFGAQDITSVQLAAPVPAEPAEGERGRAAQVGGHVQATGQQHVGAQAHGVGCADVEDAAGRNGHRFPHRDGNPVDGHQAFGAGDTHRRRMGEPQRGTRCRALQSRGVLGVAQGAVAEPERQVIHRAAGRHADLPQPDPAGHILDGGEQAGPVHGDPGPGIGDLGQGCGAVVRRAHVLVIKCSAKNSDVCLDAVQGGAGQCVAQPGQRGVAVIGVRDDFGQQRIVGRGDLGAVLHPGVDPELWEILGVGEADGGDGADAGPVVPGRVLGVDACLHRVPVHRYCAAGIFVDHARIAGGQPHHPGGEIHSGDGLGDRMLDLQACVDLQEGCLLAFGVVDELDGARGAVVHRCGQCPRGGVQPFPDEVGKSRRGSLLDHLLVPALQ